LSERKTWNKTKQLQNGTGMALEWHWNGTGMAPSFAEELNGRWWPTAGLRYADPISGLSARPRQ